EKQFAMEFGNRMRFREHDFQTVRKVCLGALRPSHGALRGTSRHADGYFHCPGGHHAASFAPAFTGVRKTMARFSFRNYFFAPACISSRLPARNPSQLV